MMPVNDTARIPGPDLPVREEAEEDLSLVQVRIHRDLIPVNVFLQDRFAFSGK